jgi:hypothetical protein
MDEMIGLRGSQRVVLQEVNVGGEVRRMGVVRQPPRLVWIVAVALLVVGVVLLLSGHGGFDGAFGVLIAFLVLVGAAAVIQRLSKPAVAFGYNPDGVYAGRQGWIPWVQVRRIEVRRRRAPLGGWRTTLWVGFEPHDEDTTVAAGELAWTSVTPGWGTNRVADLAARLETLWARAPGAGSERPETAG